MLLKNKSTYVYLKQILSVNSEKLKSCLTGLLEPERQRKAPRKEVKLDVPSRDTAALPSHLLQSWKIVSWVLHPCKNPQPWDLSPSFTISALPEAPGFCCPRHTLALDKSSRDWRCIGEKGVWLGPTSLLLASPTGPQLVSRISWELAAHIRNSPECFLTFHLA